MDLDQYTPAGYGDSVEYTKALAMAGTGTADVDEVPYSDAWGEFYSAYSPVMDSSGNNNFSAQTKSGRHLPEMCVTMETGSADCRWFRYDKWKQEMGVFDPEHLANAAAGAGVSLTRKEWYSLYLASGKYLP